MINYVDKMADALVDVLKYSNQDVEWVEIWSPGNPSWFSICTDRRRKRYGGAWI